MHKEEGETFESRVDCVRVNHFTFLPWLKRNFNSKREGEEKNKAGRVIARKKCRVQNCAVQFKFSGFATSCTPVFARTRLKGGRCIM